MRGPNLAQGPEAREGTPAPVVSGEAPPGLARRDGKAGERLSNVKRIVLLRCTNAVDAMFFITVLKQLEVMES
jgi:hypothetical protein